jgi:hypothetical protein
MSHKAIQSPIRSLNALQTFLSLKDCQEIFVCIKRFNSSCSNSKPFKVIENLTRNNSQETFCGHKALMPHKAIKSLIRFLEALQGNFSVLERLPGNFCVYKAF